MRSTAPKRALIACSTFDYPYHSPQSRLFGDTLTHNLIARAADAGIEAELVDTLQGGVSPEAALKGFDLLVVLGGADVHPNLYGHERSRYTRTSPDEAGDLFEISLLRHAVGTGTDVLAICRGMQLLNVALGGSLEQHLPPTGRHYSPENSASFVDHPVNIISGTHLASIFGSEAIEISSAHHQAVQVLGEGLSVAARADDGVVEAVERAGDNLVIGVQWHPEAIQADQQAMIAMLKAYA